MRKTSSLYSQTCARLLLVAILTLFSRPLAASGDACSDSVAECHTFWKSQNINRCKVDSDCAALFLCGPRELPVFAGNPRPGDELMAPTLRYISAIAQNCRESYAKLDPSKLPPRYEPILTCSGGLCFEAPTGGGTKPAPKEEAKKVNVPAPSEVRNEVLHRGRYFDRRCGTSQHIALLVDKSRSMATDGRLDRVRETISSALENLPESLTLSIIGFDESPFIIAPNQKLTTEGKAIISKRMKSLFPAGRSKLFEGLTAATELLEKYDKPGLCRSIIVFSDGQKLLPGTYDSLFSKWKAARIPISSILLDVQGEESLMRSIAENGDGTFAVATSLEGTKKIFDRILGDSLILSKLVEPLEPPKQ